MKRKKLIPLPRLKKRLWKIFSEYIRRRDADENGIVTCITCPAKAHWKEVDCGHYKKRGYLGTFVHEKNNHGQCKRCNHYLSGNESAYALALVRKYGPDILEELESLKNSRDKYSRDEYDELILVYKVKLNDMAKENQQIFGAH